MSCKIGLIAEDDSDVEVIKEIIKNIRKIKCSYKAFAPEGCSKVRDKCTKYVTQLFEWGADLVLVFHDLDRRKIEELRKDLTSRVNAAPKCRLCIIIPVEEIEAWFLADENAINNSFLRPCILKGVPSPEKIVDPKGFITRKSRIHGKPRYSNTTHNGKIASKLDLSKVYIKCPSYRPFHDAITSLKI